jgi:hypothetical protein
MIFQVPKYHLYKTQIHSQYSDVMDQNLYKLYSFTSHISNYLYFIFFMLNYSLSILTSFYYSFPMLYKEFLLLLVSFRRLFRIPNLN